MPTLVVDRGRLSESSDNGAGVGSVGLSSVASGAPKGPPGRVSFAPQFASEGEASSVVSGQLQSLASEVLEEERAAAPTDDEGGEDEDGGVLGGLFGKARRLLGVGDRLKQAGDPLAGLKKSKSMRLQRLHEQVAIHRDLSEFDVGVAESSRPLRPGEMAAGEYASLLNRQAMHYSNVSPMRQNGFGTKRVSPIARNAAKILAAQEAAATPKGEEHDKKDKHGPALRLEEWFDAGLVPRLGGGVEGKRVLPAAYEDAPWASAHVPLARHLDTGIIVWPVRLDLLPFFETFSHNKTPSATTAFHYTTKRGFDEIVAPPADAKKPPQHYAEEVWERIEDDLERRAVAQVDGAPEFSLTLTSSEPLKFDSKDDMLSAVFRGEVQRSSSAPISCCVAILVPTDACMAVPGRENAHSVVVQSPGENEEDDNRQGTYGNKKLRLVSWNNRGAVRKTEDNQVELVRDMNLLSGILNRETGEVEMDKWAARRASRVTSKDSRRPSKASVTSGQPGDGGGLGDADEVLDEAELQAKKILLKLHEDKTKIERKIRHVIAAKDKAAQGDTEVSLLKVDDHLLAKLERMLAKCNDKIVETEKDLKEIEAALTITTVVDGGTLGAISEDEGEEGQPKVVVTRRRRMRVKNASEFAPDVQDFVQVVNDQYAGLAEDVFRNVFGGNIEGVKEWMDAGGDPNVYHASTGWTPLIMAASAGEPDIVKMLVDHQGDLMKGSVEYGWTPMHFAVRKSRMQMMEFLKTIDERCVRTRARDMATPLLVAVEDAPVQVRDQMVRVLLEAHGDANAERSDGWNPLSAAVVRNLKVCCKLLVQNRGNVFLKCPDTAANGREARTIWEGAARHTGLQQLLKSKMNSRDVQALEKRWPGTLGVSRKR